MIGSNFTSSIESKGRLKPMENKNIELNLKIEKRDVHKIATQNIMLDTSQISAFSNK